MPYDYDPLKALNDKELIRLVSQAAEPWFGRHQRDLLEELIRRYEAAIDRKTHDDVDF